MAPTPRRASASPSDTSTSASHAGRSSATRFALFFALGNSEDEAAENNGGRAGDVEKASLDLCKCVFGGLQADFQVITCQSGEVVFPSHGHGTWEWSDFRYSADFALVFF